MMDNKEHIAALQFIASQYAAPNFTMEREAMNAAIAALQQQGEAVIFFRCDDCGYHYPAPVGQCDCMGPNASEQTRVELYPHSPKPVVSDVIVDMARALEMFVSHAEPVDLGHGDAVVTTCESLDAAKKALEAALGVKS